VPAAGTARGPASSHRVDTPGKGPRLTGSRQPSLDGPRRGLAYAAVTVAIILLVWESMAIAHGLALLFGR
jgi:hypothetical protein